jgi:parallel beta-helix repeat protein
VILLATTSYIWANPDEIAIVEHSFIKSGSYVIENDDDTYKAFNGQTGALDYSGTNATTVVQNALDALTSGRSWQETVILQGNFDFDSNIRVPSYTRIEVQGNLSMTGTTDKDYSLFWNENAGDTDISIIGGRYKSALSGDAYGSVVYYEEVTNGDISDMIIDWQNDIALYIEGCKNVTITNNRINVDDAGGMTLLSASSHCRVLGNYIEITQSGDGIKDLGGSTGNVIANNQITVGTGYAIDVDSSYMTVVANNYLKGSYTNPITLAWLCKSNEAFFSNNVLEEADCGFYLAGAKHCTVTNNIIKNMSVQGLRQYNFGGNAKNNTIMGNSFKDCPIGLQIDCGGYNVYDGNNLRDCVTPISFGGSYNNIIKRNYGFVTENSGTQTCADNEAITHGLAGTPTMVAVTCANMTYDSQPVAVGYYHDTMDSTDFHVRAYWAHNGTAITDDVVFVSWYVIYEP